MLIREILEECEGHKVRGLPGCMIRGQEGQEMTEGHRLAIRGSPDSNKRDVVAHAQRNRMTHENARARPNRAGDVATAVGQASEESTGYEPFALHAPIQWAI